jgi:putative N-acetylmannosamine-6-phosphate epimerase
MIKTRDANGDIYITPQFRCAQAVSEAGADIIALDCTHRRLAESEPWPALMERIHTELDRPVLADVATLEDALAAETAGADAVATTLYGYTAETSGLRAVSWPLIESLVSLLKIPVIVEGHITQPEEMSKAFELGAHCVVVGAAITRPDSIAARFVRAIPV